MRQRRVLWRILGQRKVTEREAIYRPHGSGLIAGLSGELSRELSDGLTTYHLRAAPFAP
jgi:hypothetical protein